MAHPVCSFMRFKLKDYLSQKGESLRWLSKQTQIEYHKLYRLEADELRSMSFFEARRLLKFVEPESYLESLRNFYPEEMKDLSDISLSESQIDLKLEAVEFALSSHYHYELFLFASETPGANRTLIEKQYGLKGLSLIDLLLEKGALTPGIDGGFIGIFDGASSPSEGILKSITKAHIDLIDLGEAGSFAGTHGKGLNLEGKRRSYKILADASHELFKLFENPEFLGHELTVFTLICGSIKGGRA